MLKGPQIPKPNIEQWKKDAEEVARADEEALEIARELIAEEGKSEKDLDERAEEMVLRELNEDPAVIFEEKKSIVETEAGTVFLNQAFQKKYPEGFDRFTLEEDGDTIFLKGQIAGQTKLLETLPSDLVQELIGKIGEELGKSEGLKTETTHPEVEELIEREESEMENRLIKFRKANLDSDPTSLTEQLEKEFPMRKIDNPRTIEKGFFFVGGDNKGENIFCHKSGGYGDSWSQVQQGASNIRALGVEASPRGLKASKWCTEREFDERYVPKMRERDLGSQNKEILREKADEYFEVVKDFQEELGAGIWHDRDTGYVISRSIKPSDGKLIASFRVGLPESKKDLSSFEALKSERFDISLPEGVKIESDRTISVETKEQLKALKKQFGSVKELDFNAQAQIPNGWDVQRKSSPLRVRFGEALRSFDETSSRVLGLDSLKLKKKFSIEWVHPEFEESVREDFDLVPMSIGRTSSEGGKVLLPKIKKREGEGGFDVDAAREKVLSEEGLKERLLEEFTREVEANLEIFMRKDKREEKWTYRDHSQSFFVDKYEMPEELEDILSDLKRSGEINLFEKKEIADHLKNHLNQDAIQRVLEKNPTPEELERRKAEENKRFLAEVNLRHKNILREAGSFDSRYVRTKLSGRVEDALYDTETGMMIYRVKKDRKSFDSGQRAREVLGLPVNARFSVVVEEGESYKRDIDTVYLGEIDFDDDAEKMKIPLEEFEQDEPTTEVKFTGPSSLESRRNRAIASARGAQESATHIYYPGKIRRVHGDGTITPDVQEKIDNYRQEVALKYSSIKEEFRRYGLETGEKKESKPKKQEVVNPKEENTLNEENPFAQAFARAKESKK